ncbi:hypothetical protein MASR1M90_14370 [Desulfovibrionales bacterium]
MWLGAKVMSSVKLAKDVMPNVDEAIVAIEKISGYILDPDNEKGKHKAKVLASAFGLQFNEEDAEYLRSAIASGLANGTVTSESHSKHGKKYNVAIAITGKNGHSEEMTTGWIIDKGSEIPRFVTAILKGKKK